MSTKSHVNILLVDDRPDNLLALEAVLRDPAYNLLSATSGGEALEHLGRCEVALILLDVQMPGMDGVETAHQIKRTPRYRDIPIIFVTAISKDPAHVFRGYESGAIDYLMKPFDDHVLRAKVAVIVDLYLKTQQIKRQERALIQANGELQKEVQERQHAEAALRLVHEELERRVRERTAELASTNHALQQEILERKRIEHALRESEERFRILVEGVKDYAIVMLDPVGHVISWNQGAERITGYPAEEIVGKEWSIFYSPEEREEGKPIREMQVTLASGRLEIEGWRLRKDGTRFWANVVTTTLHDSSGRFRGFAKVICDVTDRKHADERLRTALTEKEILLKEIHHRVKNNLQVISSLLSLQSDGVRSPEVLSMFEQSRHRIRSMALVHEQLYGTKDFVHIDMAAYLRNLVTQLVASYAKADCVECVLNLDQALVGIDTAMPCGLLVNELVSNTLKHAFPDGRRGLLAVTLRAEASGYLSLAIRDNGVGLPAHFTLGKTDSLGLRLVEALVEQLSAQLALERQPGTSYHIRFPRASAYTDGSLYGPARLAIG